MCKVNHIYESHICIAASLPRKGCCGRLVAAMEIELKNNQPEHSVCIVCGMIFVGWTCASVEYVRIASNNLNVAENENQTRRRTRAIL